MDYGEEINGEGESNYTHSAPDNKAVVPWSPRRRRHTGKQKSPMKKREVDAGWLCVCSARRQFSDKPLHKQIRPLFNQLLMIFIDRQREARARRK